MAPTTVYVGCILRGAAGDKVLIRISYRSVVEQVVAVPSTTDGIFSIVIEVTRVTSVPDEIVTGLVTLPTLGQSVTGTIRVEAPIDGKSQLILRENTAQWFHIFDAAPGRLFGSNEPTVINGVEWFPVWPDVPDSDNRDCNCLSDVFTGVDPALPQTDMTVDLRFIAGRSTDRVSIVQLPIASNDFTLIIEFDDQGICCSLDYIVELDFMVTGGN